MVIRSHRLFLGCPLPGVAAAALAKWAEGSFDRAFIRLVPAEKLHATLIFYGSVEPQTKDLLADLTRLVRWRALHVTVKGLDQFAQGAVVARLNLPDSEFLHLMRLLYPPRDTADPKELGPLQQMMLLRLAKSEKERTHALKLHVTLGRTKKRFPMNMEAPPDLSFELGRAILYESFTEPAGSRYEILAEAQTG